MAIHPRQRVGRWLYLELCPSYIATMVECCYETTRQAWQAVRSSVGWWQVPHQQAQDMGATLRHLHAGQRHGRHMLLTPEASEGIRALAVEAGIMADTPDEQVQWSRVVPLRSGSSLVARCPFHDDRTPSMLLDPTRSRATCLACRTVHRLRSDGWLVSCPVSVRGSRERSYPEAARVSGTIGYKPGPGSVAVVCLRSAGAAYTAAPGSLLDVLAYSGERAKRARVPVMSGCLEDPSRTVPDLLVSLDRMTRCSTRAKKCGWMPTSTRHICVDVDDLDWAPLEDEQLVDAAEEIRARLAGVPLLSGAMAMVRTSLLGVQVTLELAAEQPVSWRRTKESEDLHDKVDNIVMQALHAHGCAGGYADPTARGIGRLIRRAGPRVSRKTRQPWVARLVYLRREHGNREEDCDGSRRAA